MSQANEVDFVNEVDLVPLLVMESEKKGLPLWLKSLAGRQPSFFYSIPER